MKTILSIIIAGILIGGAVLLLRGSGPVTASRDNVHMENSTQIVDISVKGGYRPQNTIAKAGVPTVVRFTTNGTFDCSSAIRIPSLGIAQNLPQSGSTDIPIGTQQTGTLKGVCAMGMYSFSINFE